MGDAITRADIPQMQDALAVRKLIKREQAYAVFDLFGGELAFAQKEGMTMRRRKYRAPVSVNVPATEAITPPSKKPGYDDYEATIKQYIGWTQMSDVQAASSIEAMEAELVEWLNEDMWVTQQLVYRDYLLAGTSVYYGNGAATRLTSRGCSPTRPAASSGGGELTSTGGCSWRSRASAYAGSRLLIPVRRPEPDLSVGSAGSLSRASASRSMAAR